MRKSQYLEKYLAENDRRSEPNGLTVGTFLKYVLRGESSRYAKGYGVTLVRSLESVGAHCGVSKLGKVAYYTKGKV